MNKNCAIKDNNPIRLVVIESPYSPQATDEQAAAVELARNLAFARACMADCFKQGERPFASHLLFTQPGVLNDKVIGERELGIQAGFDIAQALHVVAQTGVAFEFIRLFYCNRGWTDGMAQALEEAVREGQHIERRWLPADRWSRAYDADYSIWFDGTLHHVSDDVLEKYPVSPAPTITLPPDTLRGMVPPAFIQTPTCTPFVVGPATPFVGDIAVPSSTCDSVRS